MGVSLFKSVDHVIIIHERSFLVNNKISINWLKIKRKLSENKGKKNVLIDLFISGELSRFYPHFKKIRPIIKKSENICSEKHKK